MTSDELDQDEWRDGIDPKLRPDLDTIADLLFSGHAAVMIGAGLSKNVGSHSGPGFPDWSQLGDRFYEKVTGRPPGPNERYLHVPKLAHQVEAAFGRPVLNQMLQDEIPDARHEPSRLHVELLGLPWSDVFTTNYDTLLERAARSVTSEQYDLVDTSDDLRHSKRPRIVKLHGSLPSGPFVITDEDYRQYPDHFAPFVNVVRQSLLENTLCLLGFSGDDVNFQRWIGWLHDNVGLQNLPKMYLVGLLNFVPAEERRLNSLNITPIDMSLCRGIDSDHYNALQLFLDYLQSRRADNRQSDWPRSRKREPASSDANEPSKVVRRWEEQRVRYPGWVVLPEDRRLLLWQETIHWIHELPRREVLSGILDLEFAFELTWRLERCLCPLFDNHAAFVETTLDRYCPSAHCGTTLGSPAPDETHVSPRRVDRDTIRYKCHHLQLAMMRYYREEGLSAKYDVTCGRIEAVLSSLSPEHAAQFHYERALSALFALNPEQAKIRLGEWRCDDALPFWTARKAGLLAETGQVAEATDLLRRALSGIRGMLRRLKADYTLASQESFAMYLLHVVRQGSLLRAAGQSEIRAEREQFRERWHELKQYECDPWQELETFEHKLQRTPAAASDVTDTPTFDIGRSVRTHHLGRWNSEALAAYNFLRFCEDAGLPFRVPGCTIATKSATFALARIRQSSPHWARVTLVRIGDRKAVDEIFDRRLLAGMSVESVDSLIEHYINSLELGPWISRSGTATATRTSARC